MTKSKVYFIRADNGLVKIGKSVKPSKRVKDMQGMSPINLRIVKTIPGGIYMESILHVYFSHLRKHGEWFRPDRELKNYLAGKARITTDALRECYLSHKRAKKGMRRYLNHLVESTGYI